MFFMNQGKYVFAQLTEFFPKRVFDCIVVRYSGINMFDFLVAGIKFYV